MKEINQWRAVAQVAPHLSCTEARTLVAIQLRLAELGTYEAQVSREDIAAIVGTNKRVVGLAMQKLVEMNFLVILEPDRPRVARVIALNYHAMLYHVRQEAAQPQVRPRDRSPVDG